MYVEITLDFITVVIFFWITHSNYVQFDSNSIWCYFKEITFIFIIFELVSLSDSFKSYPKIFSWVRKEKKKIYHIKFCLFNNN